MSVKPWWILPVLIILVPGVICMQGSAVLPAAQDILPDTISLIPAPDTGTAAAAGPGRDWYIENVDRTLTGGAFTSLVLDATGYPQIAYDSGSAGKLRYAWKDSTGWHTRAIPGTRYVTGPSLAVTGAGMPRISFQKMTGETGYAWKDGTGWHAAAVGPDVMALGGTSLALDESDNPHMSYSGIPVSAPEMVLRYAWKDAAGWHNRTLRRIPYGMIFSHALAPDGAGDPGIAYIYADGSDLGISYAWKKNGRWHTDYTGATDAGTASLSLARDSAGNPRIAWYSETAHRLMYTWKDSTGWHTIRVDDGGQLSSLTLDSSGRPHIAYLDLAAGTLRYAVRQDGWWKKQTVDRAGWGRVSLVLDDFGRPGISYLNEAGTTLKFAKYATPSLLGT